jgi:hypothetical protein
MEIAEVSLDTVTSSLKSANNSSNKSTLKMEGRYLETWAILYYFNIFHYSEEEIMTKSGVSLKSIHFSNGTTVVYLQFGTKTKTRVNEHNSSTVMNGTARVIAKISLIPVGTIFLSPFLF